MRALTAALMLIVLAPAAAWSQAKWTDPVFERGEVSLIGRRLVRDGHPWRPRGVVQIAFVAPPAAQQGVFAAAFQNYSPSDYPRMRTFGIDSVRLQVSQPGLDPKSALFDPQFLKQVIAAVSSARSARLTVLISIQDEAQSGETDPAPLPNDGTRRVWRELAPIFGQDMGVMYELLNEPQPTATDQHWQAWAAAMNETIAVVRSTGARNVVIADGLLFGERLQGAPALDDPLHGVVYASHPYAHSASDQTPVAWASKFGDFALTHPVIVTEWTTSSNFYCDANTAASVPDFLFFLRDHDVGLMAYAWDFSGVKFGSTFESFPAEPTTFRGVACGESWFGPGREVVRSYQPW